jgi:nucleotide-binding universal stress UspA family protein
MKTKTRRFNTRSAKIRSPKLRTTRYRAQSGPDDVIELVPALLKIKDILVPVDFSEPSLKALKYALAFAEQFGAKLFLLHVVEPVVVPDFASVPMPMDNNRLATSAKARLEHLCKRRGLERRLVHKKLVRTGTPFREITDAARALKVDLIVIATHGYTGLAHAILGSTAERVVRHAPCPVLTVREKEHEFVSG